MINQQLMNPFLRVVAAALLLVPGAIRAQSPADVTPVVSFSGPNGSTPYSSLLPSADGNFYGTTYRGGTTAFPGLGTVFRLTTNGSLTTLASFNTTNGAKPFASLIQHPDGNLYGTTSEGGTNGIGTIFRITTNGLLTSLYSFTTNSGEKPSARLTLGNDGALYGTAQLGGSKNQGTIFRVTTNGSLTILFSLGDTNGALPYAELLQATDGHLYGTTTSGGTWNLGTVFRVTTNGAFTVLYSFDNTNGAKPYGGLIQGAGGILYGTTAYGGTNDSGTIFQITTNGSFLNLHFFVGDPDGANPFATLLRGSDGFLYGTTILGGASDINGSWGTVFQISTNGLFASLAAFHFDTNGTSPYGGLVQDASSSLYTTTSSQGSGSRGTIVRLKPGQPFLEASRTSANTLRVAWNAWLGKSYQVQSTTNLSQPNWTDLGGAFSATNSQIAITNSTLIGPSRFHRVKLLPSP